MTGGLRMVFALALIVTGGLLRDISDTVVGLGERLDEADCCRPYPGQLVVVRGGAE